MQLHEVELKRKKENSFEPVKNPTTKRNDAIYIYSYLCRTKIPVELSKRKGTKIFQGVAIFHRVSAEFKGARIKGR